MNEDERRRTFKAKRKAEKKKRRKKEKGSGKVGQPNLKSSNTNQQEAEQIVQGRINQGELIVCSQQERNATGAASTGPEVDNPASHYSSSKRRCTTQQQEGPPKKTVRCQCHQHALKK